MAIPVWKFSSDFYYVNFDYREILAANLTKLIDAVCRLKQLRPWFYVDPELQTCNEV